jgi:rhodanese-related sulfurtransferase
VSVAAGRPAIGRPVLRLLLRRALPQALLLCALGALLGLGLNALRPDPLPIDLPGALLLNESGASVVFTEGARRLFDEGRYIFVDARDAEHFARGHIEGAFGMPLSEFDALYPELQTWTAGQPLLVYAARERFLVADDLARRLRQEGEPDVVILGSGYEGWTARGYPVETGREGLLGSSADWSSPGAPD